MSCSLIQSLSSLVVENGSLQHSLLSTFQSETHKEWQTQNDPLIIGQISGLHAVCAFNTHKTGELQGNSFYIVKLFRNSQ